MAQLYSVASSLYASLYAYSSDNMQRARPNFGVLSAAVAGSVVEWYDLFVYGSLVVVLSSVFFPSNGGIPSILPSIGAFVAGAAVRPLGGAVFGRFGDLIGRKFAFIMTTVIMGLGSILVGFLPTYNQVGFLAPLALVLLRILQGLALGGEYGGGVLYIAENCSDRNRGLWTSFTQVASTLGLFLATVVVLFSRLYLGNAAFESWGWRIPFLAASFLLVIALAIRWRLAETALFSALKESKGTSNAPISESLAKKENLNLIVLTLLIVSGSAVVWHTAQFYTSIFMQNTLKLNILTSSEITVVALAFGSPFFVFFGWLSDRVGRLPIIFGGSVLGALAFYPTYYAINLYSRPPNISILTGLLFIQIFFSAMCYGPLGALLVETFPAKVRYTSMSISYGIGTGDIGDATLVIAPIIALALSNIYAGLIWSTLVPIFCAFIGLFFFKETRKRSIWSEVAQK
ncbi:MAG: MFS transporter [Nitrososphaerales archaeon]